MTISNGYATLAELRAKLGHSNPSTTSSNDTQYEQIIEAASRWIDKYTNRRFYGVAETRYYTAEDGYEIQVDDLTSISALKTDDNGDGVFETTWASTQYILKYGENLNAALDGKPYTQIEISESGGKEFPVHIRKGVMVAGTFGYISSTASTACPDPIHDAALLVAERIYKRKDAPLGIAGAAPLGQQPVRITSLTVDPDIKALLDPYRRVA